MLKWTTADEQNTSHFAVEQSTDGINFVEVGAVTAQGNGIGKAYDFWSQQAKGTSFYRLKMVDIDNEYTYSSVVTVKTNCQYKTRMLTAFPNPVRGGEELHVNLLGYDGAVTGNIYSSAGQLINTIILINGVNTVKTGHLVAGLYNLSVTDKNGNTESVKVVITR